MRTVCGYYQEVEFIHWFSGSFFRTAHHYWDTYADSVWESWAEMGEDDE